MNNPTPLSPPQKPLCVVGRLGEGKKKPSARRTMGREREEARPLPYSVRLSNRICGSVVLAKPGDYLGDFEGWCEDNSEKA